MEPLAPGTEDDPPIEYSSLTKQETEHERLLKQKAILKNGQYDNIFEFSYVNGAEHWFCKVCECPVMGRVYQHELGRRHTQNLHMTNRHLEKKGTEQGNEDPSLDIAPGEPAPPGFEGEVNRHAQIQERLDGFKVGPLVALEYLIEMQDYDVTKEPLYLCILCDKRGDPRTVLTHLASYNHISQYLQKHFPTCYRALAPYMTKQYKRNWQTTLQKIAEAIETRFGRLRPFSIEQDKFEKDRLQYLTMISKGRHFSERSGYTFVELVVRDELTKVYDDEKGESHITSASTSSWSGKTSGEKTFQKRSPSPPIISRPNKKTKGSPPSNFPSHMSNKDQSKKSTGFNVTTKPSPQPRRRSLSSVSSISSSDLSDDDERFKKTGQKNRSALNYSRDRRLPYSRDRRRSPSPRRGPWDRSRTKEFSDSRSKEKERLEKFDEYKKLAKAIDKDMEKTLHNHEKNPEKHPKYNDEWKLFWNRRYKELQAEGKDTSNHDFKPEWIEFWGKRMLEIQQEEIKARKEALRRRLGLPEEPSPVSFRIAPTGRIVKPSLREINKPNLPMAAQPDNDPEVIIIDDRENDDKMRNRDRSHSPWERNSPRTDHNKLSRERSPFHSKFQERVPSKRLTNRDGTLRSPIRDKYNRNSQERLSQGSSHRRSKSVEKISRKSRSPDTHSRSRDSHSISREREPYNVTRSFSRERKNSKERDRVNPRDRGRDGRSRSRDRSWERDRSLEKKNDFRESSFERDLRGRERIRTVADLPWAVEKGYRCDYENYYKPPPIMRDATRKPVINPSTILPIIPLEDDNDDEGDVNIVSVLRLLTALEERLGSLGPKIIDLLAQALALEKKEANSAETLLENEINCVMFETVKEKLKGQLLAGLVDMVQERAFKKAIKKTASLIHIAAERKREREHKKPKVTVVPGIGTVDKTAIAKQIANALIAQGKTDVTQAELEQLINAVVGMAEASKRSNKPITTANFLEQVSSSETASRSEKIVNPTGKSNEKEARGKSDVANLDELTEPLTPPTPEKYSTGNMENLSDSDLQTLLQNFKDLSTEEQMNLINYLKKLEHHEPDRVERLRKYVNLGSTKNTKDDERESDMDRKFGRESPFSNRKGSLNPTLDDSVEIKSDNDDKLQEKTQKVHVDSEDEEYTDEDVVKAVSKNVKAKEFEDSRRIVEDSIEFENTKSKDVNLSDAKALISNLMSNFSKNSSSINLLGLGSSNTPSTPMTNTVTSTVEFAKTFDSISVASLASIVSNVKNMTSDNSMRITETPKNKLNIDPNNLDIPQSPNTRQNIQLPRPNFATSNRHIGSEGSGMFGGASNSMHQPRAMGPCNGQSGNNRFMGPGKNITGPYTGSSGSFTRSVGPRCTNMVPSTVSTPPGSHNMGPGGLNVTRPMVQYPRSQHPYGGNFQQNNFTQQNLPFASTRGPRTPFNQGYTGGNPRFGTPSGQFTRPPNGNYNRW